MEKVDAVFRRLYENTPTPRIELQYRNEFTLLVAIVLSARSTDVGVNKVTAKLFEVVDTPESMLALGEEELRKRISSIGLYNSKARNIIKFSEIIVSEYGGEVPKDFRLLTALPGVGRKSANVFLNSALGAATVAVDTHVFRVSNRLGLVREVSILATEKSLMRVIPEQWKPCAHNWLVLHGRYVCKARKPLCNECVIEDLCDSSRLRKGK